MSWSERPCRGGARLLVHQRRSLEPCSALWDLRRVPVCSSTEILLKQWLVQTPQLQRPRAVLARHQRWGVGQRGRVWQAPVGGVWLSAALPVVAGDASPAGAGLWGLAVALALAERLEQVGVAVRIKWPNDLLVDGRKLAGVLPGLVQRGTRLRLLRCGVGLNVSNPVPAGGVALRRLLPAATPEFWASELLLALEAGITKLREPAHLLAQVQTRLWADEVVDPADGGLWRVDGLSPAGGLQLRRGLELTEWVRWP